MNCVQVGGLHFENLKIKICYKGIRTVCLLVISEDSSPIITNALNLRSVCVLCLCVCACAQVEEEKKKMAFKREQVTIKKYLANSRF